MRSISIMQVLRRPAATVSSGTTFFSSRHQNSAFCRSFWRHTGGMLDDGFRTPRVRATSTPQPPPPPKF